MDSSIISSSVALAGVLSGTLVILFGAALIHLLILRRRAKKRTRAAQRLIALDRRHHGSTSSQSDSDLGSLEAAEGDEKDSRVSINLTPNQPMFVDLEAVYGGAGAGGGNGGAGTQAGLQLILTPPTPRRVNREIP